MLQPSSRKDANSLAGHEALVKKTQAGKIDAYFLGDSITRRWGALDYPQFLAHWQQSFHGWNAANFGWGGDSVENILWRIENGELAGVNPKVIVVLAGTNNLRKGFTPGEGRVLAEKIEALVARCRQLAPGAKIILMGLFPRNDHEGLVPVIREINAELANYAKADGIHFLDIGDHLADADGVLRPGISKDKLHLELPGYQIWAEALSPLLESILGPKAKDDQAPPPTGDPSAVRKASS